MASFTDQLVAFNPYVSQIPVDDYTRVGMIKQQQYDQGVQKVQGYIDSVAGLEVIKPEQKDYLHQRVSNLQQEVGKVVSKDFSNQQLTNSVGALTSKIANDPIIQTSVASTQAYKQGLANMREAKEKGTLNASNEWDFQDQFQKWYNDKDATTRFTGEYTPYTDVAKKAMDAFDKVLEKVPNIHTEDNPFQRDVGGVIKYEKGPDGKPRPLIDMAMMEKTYKGVTPERVESILQSVLNENDRRQLAIDGRYEYRGYNKDMMKGVVDQHYTHDLGQMNDIIQGLQVKRMGLNNDPEGAALVDQQIQNYKDRAVSIQDRYKRDVNYIDKDLEGYKGMFYSDGWIGRLTNGLAYSQESLTYKENPYFMAAEKKRENDIKYQEFLVNKQFDAAKLLIEQAKLRLEEKKTDAYVLAMQAKAAKTAHGQLEGIPLADAVMEPIPQDQMDDINVANFLGEINTTDKEIDDQKMALLAQKAPDLVILRKDQNGMNTRYEYNVKGKDPEKVKLQTEATMAALKAQYDKNPDSVDPATQSYFKRLANDNQFIQNSKFALGNLEKMADRDVGSLDQIVAGMKPLRFASTSGAQYSLAPKQVIDFNRKMQGLQVNIPYNQTGGPVYDEQQAAKVLTTPAERFLFNVLRKPASQRNQYENQIASQIGEFYQKGNIPANHLLEGRDVYKNNAVKDLVGVQQGVTFTLEAFKAADRNRARSVASQLLGQMARDSKGSPQPGFDKGDAESMLGGKHEEKTQYGLRSKGRGQYTLIMTNPDVNTKGTELPLTRQQAEELFGQGKFIDDFNNIRRSLQLSKSTGQWTTDVTGQGVNSAFNLDNGNLNKYSVKYHVEDPLKNGGLQVRMYIYDKVNQKWLPDMVASVNGQLLNEAQVTKFLSAAGDQYIESVLDAQKAKQ